MRPSISAMSARSGLSMAHCAPWSSCAESSSTCSARSSPIWILIFSGEIRQPASSCAESMNEVIEMKVRNRTAERRRRDIGQDSSLTVREKKQAHKLQPSPQRGLFRLVEGVRLDDMEAHVQTSWRV